jgi:lipoprotein signal peptidase
MNFLPKLECNLRKPSISTLYLTFSTFRWLFIRLILISIIIGKWQTNADFSRKPETISVWSKGKNLFQNRTKGIIWSKMKYGSWSFHIGAEFQSGTFFSSILPFWTESVLSERLSLKLMLTSTSADLGKVHYTKVVDNFDIFPKSTNTPLFDK